MISTVINGVIAALMAKFIMNDLPHAAGLSGNTWVDQAWGKLAVFAESRGIRVQEIISKAVQTENISETALRNYKKLFGGYYVIAIGEAPDSIVDSVYCYLKGGIAATRKALEEEEGKSFAEILKEARRDAGVPEDREVTSVPEPDSGYLGMLEGVIYAGKLFTNGTRANKVLAIDSTMYIIHATEGIIQFIVPDYFGDLLLFMGGDILDLLRGKTPSYYANKMLEEA